MAPPNTTYNVTFWGASARQAFFFTWAFAMKRETFRKRIGKKFRERVGWLAIVKANPVVLLGVSILVNLVIHVVFRRVAHPNAYLPQAGEVDFGLGRLDVFCSQGENKSTNVDPQDCQSLRLIRLQDDLDTFLATCNCTWSNLEQVSQMTTFLRTLSPHLELEPCHSEIYEINWDEILANSLKCDDPLYVDILTGNTKNTFDHAPALSESGPTKIVVAFPFSGELDLLEIRLFELEHVADFFVIIESVLTHHAVRKELFFARNTQRFTRFVDKIIHVVLDDLDLLHLKDSKMSQSEHDQVFWGIEREQTRKTWRKMVRHFDHQLKDQDLIIFGDLDELISSQALLHLKYCQIKREIFPIRSNTLFHMFNLNWIYKGDYPASERFPYSHSFPITDTWYNVKTLKRLPRYETKATTKLPPSGWHISSYANPALFFYKQMTIAESGKMTHWFQEYLSNVSRFVDEVATGKIIDKVYGPNKKRSLSAVSSDVRNLYSRPMFVEANKLRYPYLFS